MWITVNVGECSSSGSSCSVYQSIDQCDSQEVVEDEEVPMQQQLEQTDDEAIALWDRSVSSFRNI